MKRYKKPKGVMLVLFFLSTVFIVNPLFGFDESFEGHVTWIEGAYLPDFIQFTMDNGNASCPAGNHLWWKDLWGGNRPTNIKLVYSQLLAAMTTGKLIKLDMYNIYEGLACVGEYIQILNDQGIQEIGTGNEKLHPKKSIFFHEHRFDVALF